MARADFSSPPELIFSKHFCTRQKILYTPTRPTAQPPCAPSHNMGYRDGLVNMTDGSQKLVSELGAGDSVKDAAGNAQIVKQVVRGQPSHTVTMVKLGECTVTQNHPIWVGGKWVHPSARHGKFVVEEQPTLYNVQLEKGGSSLSVGGMFVLAIGHDIREGFIAPHGLYGNSQLVSEWLATCEQVAGAPAGQVEAVRIMREVVSVPVQKGVPISVHCDSVRFRAGAVGELIHDFFDGEASVVFGGGDTFHVHMDAEKVTRLCAESKIAYKRKSSPVYFTLKPRLLSEKPDTSHIKIEKKCQHSVTEVVYVTFPDAGCLEWKACELKKAKPDFIVSVFDGGHYKTLLACGDKRAAEEAHKEHTNVPSNKRPKVTPTE